jgi:hypothetical protein
VNLNAPDYLGTEQNNKKIPPPGHFGVAQSPEYRRTTDVYDYVADRGQS